MSFLSPVTVRFVIGVYDITIPGYLWGFRTGRIFHERQLGQSYAHLFRERLGISVSVLQVHFEDNRTTLERLRNVGYEAQRTGQPVTVYPNSTAEPLVSMDVDWETTQRVVRKVDGRDVIEVTLQGRSGGIPAPTPSDFHIILHSEGAGAETLGSEGTDAAHLGSES